MKYLSIKNYRKHQHYKDRRPPWIKLHAEILDDYEFLCLQDASKAHLMLLWVLASKLDNRIPYDVDFIAKKIGATDAVDIQVFVRHGFMEVSQDDSDALADGTQSAMPETEAETEAETQQPRAHSRRGKDDPDADAKKKALADAVKRVSTHYTTTHPRRKITPELKKLIGRRLDRHSAEDLIEAIDGNATDPWHVEKSKHELSYVLRNSEHVEMFVEKHRAFAAAESSQIGTEHGADTSTRRADALYKLFVQHGFSQPLPIEQHDAKIDMLAAQGALKQPERIKLELRAVAPWGWFRSVRPGFERQAIERIARDIATVPRTNGAASAPAGGA